MRHKAIGRQRSVLPGRYCHVAHYFGQTGLIPMRLGSLFRCYWPTYCCEQAAIALHSGDLTEARTQLDQALKYDRSCTRATLMSGELELKAGNPARAVKTLQLLKEQAPDFVSESADLLRQALIQLNHRSALRSYLMDCYVAKASTPLLIALAEEIRAVEGSEQAKDFLRKHLVDKPSLGGTCPAYGTPWYQRGR